MKCAVDECPNERARGEYCWTHIKRKQRKSEALGPPRAYGMTKRELIQRQCLRVAEAESDEEYDRAMKTLVEQYLYRHGAKRRPDNVHRPAESGRRG